MLKIVWAVAAVRRIHENTVRAVQWRVLMDGGPTWGDDMLMTCWMIAVRRVSGEVSMRTE